jgi:catechol 2,3-dioxygenase-like lactoylglutathione lyase family enzyme
MASVFNHVAVCVSDLARSRRFYEELCGFEFVSEYVAPDERTTKLLRLPEPVGLVAVYLRMEHCILELLDYRGVGVVAPARPRVLNELGFTHMSFCVDDLDGFLARVPEYGGEVLADTHIGLAVFVRDPDGQLVEVLPMGYRERIRAEIPRQVPG